MVGLAASGTRLFASSYRSPLVTIHFQKCQGFEPVQCRKFKRESNWLRVQKAEEPGRLL